MNSVLDYSKYEQSKLTFEYLTFDLPRLIDGVVFLLTAFAEKNVHSSARTSLTACHVFWWVTRINCVRFC